MKILSDFNHLSGYNLLILQPSKPRIKTFYSRRTVDDSIGREDPGMSPRQKYLRAYASSKA